MSVDFPEPEGPITATYSLRRIWTLTPRNARTSSDPMSVLARELVRQDDDVGDGVSPVWNSWAITRASCRGRSRPAARDASAPPVVQVPDRLIRSATMVSSWRSPSAPRSTRRRDAHLHRPERSLAFWTTNTPSASFFSCRPGAVAADGRALAPVPLLPRTRPAPPYGRGVLPHRERDDRNRQRLLRVSV